MAARAPLRTRAHSQPAMQGAHVQANFAYAVARVLNSGLTFAGASALTPGQRFRASGSAVLFRVEGDGALLYVTNRHVIADTVALSINMPSWGALELPASVVGAHAARDIAVIRVANVPAAIAQARAGEPAGATEATRVSTRLAVWYADACACGAPEAIETRAAAIEGLPCCALGYPLGQESLNATTGTVTKFQVFGGDTERPLLTIDAGINHGNSGGGLWVLAPGAASGALPEAAPRVLYAGMPAMGVDGTNVLGYAIPASEVHSVGDAICALSASAGGVFINADGPFLDVRTGPPPTAQPTAVLGQRATGADEARAGLYVAEVGPCSALAPAVHPACCLARIGDATIDTAGLAQLDWLASTPGAYVGLTLEQAAATFNVNAPIDIVFADGRTASAQWDMLVNAPVRMRDACLDPAPIETLGGLTLTEMSLNLLNDAAFMAGAPWLRAHAAPAMRRTGALVVIGAAEFGPLTAVPAGMYLLALNGAPLTCMADYRTALAAAAAPPVASAPLRLTFGAPGMQPCEYVFDSAASAARTTVALGELLHRGTSLAMARIALDSVDGPAVRAS